MKSLLLLALATFVQHPTPPAVKAITALPSGTIIEGVGSSDIPITTKSEKARQLTKQGYALMHCFWFDEATRSFRDATKEDPSCPAAWLGLNASLTLPWNTRTEMKAESEYAIQRAVATCRDASDIEQGMVAAFRLRAAGTPDLEGEFEKGMLRIIESHPDAVEPRLMLALIRTQLCMNDEYDEKMNPRLEMAKVLKLIDPILEKDPHNAGALHYQIHAWEGSKPELAVLAADRLTKAAPASGHMVHMPGHIYNRVGMYEKARESFLLSVKVHEDYAAKIPGAKPTIDWNYLHDIDFLIYNLSEMGKIKEAEQFLKLNPEANQMFRWRVGHWSKLTDKSKQPYFRGMAALESGNLAVASAEADKLEQSVKKNKDTAPRSSSITRTRVEQVRAAELRGLILSRQGRHDEAAKKLAEAVAVFELVGYSEPPFFPRPPYESQGAAELAAGRHDRAIAAFKNGLRHRPNSGWMLYGIALAHEKAGRASEARKSYEDFLKAWSSADPDLPQVVAARAYLKR